MIPSSQIKNQQQPTPNLNYPQKPSQNTEVDTHTPNPPPTPNPSFYLKPPKLQHKPLSKQDHSFDKYIALLKSYGVQIHESIRCGIFQVGNGLEYSGLYTEEGLNLGEGREVVLVMVPTQLLLTAFRAESQAKQQLKQVFKTEPFYNTGPVNICQLRKLITFLLHNLQNPPPQPLNPSPPPTHYIWYQMTLHLPKQIDILQFWPQADIQLFSDPTIAQVAARERDSFEKQWQGFVEVRDRYQEVFGEGVGFGYEEYRWIYIHAVSRCFGAYMGSCYFVPFCQLFNHSCVDVSYCCYEKQQYQKLLKSIQEQKQNNKNQSEQNNQPQLSQQYPQSLSQDSGNSQDYIQQHDYSYQQISTYTPKWCSKVSFNLREKETKIIKELHQKLMDFLETGLVWRGFGLLYIGEMLERGMVVLNQYMAERRKFNKAKQELEMMVLHAKQFERLCVKYYKRLGCKYWKDKSKQISSQLPLNKQQQNSTSTSTPNPTPYTKSPTPPPTPYTNFTMTCHASQSFPPQSEVYFEYNRLSNRSLLTSYGFCLENNRYEHVWVRKSMVADIGQYPDLYERMVGMGVPVVWTVKLKPYVLNTEFIVYGRMDRWKRCGDPTANCTKDFQMIFGIVDIQQQCQIISSIIQTYKSQLPKYLPPSSPLSQSQPLSPTLHHTLLTTPSHLPSPTTSPTHHHYFASLYHREKLKILMLQIELLEGVRQVLGRLVAGKVQVKGNGGLGAEVWRIAGEVFGGRREVLGMVWGYLRGVVDGVVG